MKPREFYVAILKSKRHVHIRGKTYKRIEDLPDLWGGAVKAEPPAVPRLVVPPVLTNPVIAAVAAAQKTSKLSHKSK